VEGGLKLTSMQYGHDRMFLTQRPDSAQVHNLTHHVRGAEMIPLRVPKAVKIEHHLGQQPIISFVVRGIDEVRAFCIRFDGERQEVLRLGVDVKVRLAGSAVFASGLWLILLIQVIDKKETARGLECSQCLSRYRVGVGDGKRKLCVL